MKRTVLLIAAAFAAVCFCVTSCNKGDSGSEPESTVSEVVFLAARFDNQAQYMDQSYEIEVDGKSVSFTLSQMTKTTDSKKYSLFFSKIDDNIFMQELTDAYSVYAYSLGKLNAGQVVTCGDKTYTARPDRPALGKVNVLNAYGLYVSGTTSIGRYEVSILKGLKDEKFEEYCTKSSCSMGITHTIE